jgi:hypothetical protein
VTIFARLPDLLGAVQREDSNALIQRSRSSLAVLRRLIVLHGGDGVLMDSYDSSTSKNADDAGDGHAHHQ